MIKQTIMLAGLGCLVLLLAACENSVPTASERDHLGRYAAQAAVAKGQAIDPVARQAAMIEPALRFPARIGLARIKYGVISAVSQSEAEAWLAMVQELGPGWGEFIPISPLEVSLTCPDKEDLLGRAEGAHWTGSRCEPTAIATTFRSIRRSADNQQIDAVLIYEVIAETERNSSALAINGLALVDHLLTPSETGEAGGQAQVVLVDVRNGYIYGFAASVPDAATFAGHDKAKTAVMELAEETGIMLRDLRIELAEARLDRAQ